MRHYTQLFAAISLFAATAASAQDAVFRSFSYQGNDQRFEKTIDHNRQYFNPVMAGFQPDPSVCRAGDKFYLVNSSFSFFPGVPLYESQDLVNWQPLGHVLDRESQLPLKGQNTSGGIFAPAISYNEKNKTFYMITTNIGIGNFFVKSKDPAKGWSDPIYLKKIEGIDPSFFFDKDGKAYIVHNAPVNGGDDYEGQRAIRLFEFDVAGDSIKGDPIQIVRGGTHVSEKPIWIEGPHIFRNGKYVYLICAEGGTGEWHSEVVFRAKNPKGPWEEYSGNPILTQREGLPADRDDYVSSAGHADMVKDKNGQWWAVFLGCRPYDKNVLYNTGRDTYLLPVTWKDGWPVILDKGKAIPTVGDKTGLKHIEGLNNTGNFAYTDRFDGAKLSAKWMFLRNHTAFYTLSAQGITIKPKKANIYQRESPSAIFCRQQHENFSCETQLDFTPTDDKQLAGFALLQTETNNITCGKTMRSGKPVVELKLTCKGNSVVIASAPLTEGTLRLKIAGNGQYYDFFYAVGDEPYQPLAVGVDAALLSTHDSGGFIGACIGLYATSGKS